MTHEQSDLPHGIKLKYWLFDNYWWVICIFLPIFAVLFWRSSEPITTAATVVGALLSFTYFVQKQKLEELRLFRELFKEFNDRYSDLNEELARIKAEDTEKVSTQELPTKDQETLIDYLNLCGEEYLYFRRGYIYPSVWKAWFNGMKDNTATSRVKLLWEREKLTNSYYGLPL